MAEYFSYGSSQMTHVLCVIRLAIKVVTKDATVAVWAVNGIILLQIWNDFAILMHQVMLLVDVDHTLCTCLSMEIAKDSLKEQERKEVRVSPTRSVEEDAQTLVLHHVVSDVEQPRVENRRVKIENLLSSVGSLHFPKVLLTEVYQLLMFNISSSNNNQILSIIHPIMKFNNHVS